MSQYGFYLESANNNKPWTFKRSLGVLIWVLIMGYAHFSDASPKQSRLDHVVDLVNSSVAKGQLDFDISEICNSTKLVKKYKIFKECKAFEESQDVDCLKPKDMEEIEGCQAGEGI